MISDEAPVVPEDVLQDLAQAEGISDALVTIQASFKLIVEQLRQLSDRGTQLVSSVQESNSHLEIKLKDQADSQLQGLLSNLFRIISNLFSQLMVSKFDSLAEMGSRDSKLLFRAFHHFTEFTLGPILLEFKDLLINFVGEANACGFTNPIKDHIAQFLNRISEQTASRGPLIFKENSVISQATQTSPIFLREEKLMLDKGIQFQQVGSPVRSQQTQKEDSISNMKIEKLMEVNKTMFDKGIVMKNDLARKEEELQNALARAVSSETRVNELSKLLEDERVECRSMKRLNEQMKTELSNFVNQSKELAALREMAENEVKWQAEIEKGKANCNLLNERIRQLTQSYEGRLSDLSSQLELVENELQVEKSANYQLQSELSTQIQSNLMSESKLAEAIKAQQKLEEAYQDIERKHKKLTQEFIVVKDAENQTLAKYDELLKAAEKKFQDQCKEAELKHQKIVELLNEKLQQATSEITKLKMENSEAQSQMKEKLDLVIYDSEEKDRLIRDLQSSKNLLTDSNCELQNELDQLKSEIMAEKRKAGNESISKSQQEEETKRLKEKLSETGYRIRDLEKENNLYKEQKNSLAAKLNQTTIALDDVNQRLLEKEEQISSLQDIITKQSEQHSEDIARITSQQDVELARMTSEKTQLIKELENYQARMKEKDALLTSKIDQYERRITSLTSEQDEEKTLKGRIDTLHAQISEQEEKIIQEKTIREKLEKDLKGVSDQLEDSSRKNQRLENTLRQVVEQNQHMSIELQTTADKLKQQVGISETLREEKGRMEEEIEMTKMQLGRLNDALQEAQAKSTSLQDLSSSHHQLLEELSHKTALLEERDAQLNAVATKLTDRNSLLKKANEEFKELEKEAIELRPMKKEVVACSIQLSKAKEEVQSRDKIIETLNCELEKLKKTILEKQSELERISEQLRRSSDEARQQIESAIKHHTELENRLREDHLTELARERVEGSKKIDAIVSDMKRELEDKDRKIAQLVRDTESQNINLAQEKNEIIKKLEEKIREKDEGERQLKERTAKLTDELKIKLAEQAELHTSRINAQEKLYSKDVISLRAEIDGKVKMIEIANRELDSLKAERELLIRSIQEGREKHDKMVQDFCDMKSNNETLLAQNKVLADSLKKSQRNKNSLPRANPNPRSETSSTNAPVDMQFQGTQRIIVTSSVERIVDNHTVTNFEKHLVANNSSQQSPNPIAQYIKNKENNDTSNLAPHKNSSGTGSVKKGTREDYEKILAERLLNQEQNAPPFSFLKPPGTLQNSGTKLLIHSSPSKPQTLLATTVGGLHQLAGSDPVDLESKFDEAAKGYSSKYSRNSRNSRTSRQSPTPSKENHMSVH